MSKLVLTDAQEEQIVSMRKEDKSPKEIIAFFKESYQIDLPGWKISYIMGPSKPKKAAKVKRAGKAKSTPAPAVGGGYGHSRDRKCDPGHPADLVPDRPGL